MEILDGLQRSQIIKDFKQNKFAISNNTKDINGIKITGKKYSELPEDIKRKIDEYTKQIKDTFN